MPDTYTPNLGLIKPCTRKNWAEAVNENFEKLGVLHYYHTDGWMFICKNAICNNGVWTQPDTSLQSSVIALGNDGSFTLQTCPAGHSTIPSWTQVASFGNDGSLTLAGGLAISSGGASISGNLSVSGTITGNISTYLMLSLISINADKNWNTKNISNIGGLNVLRVVASSGTGVTKYSALSSEVGYEGSGTLFLQFNVPEGYCPFTDNVFKVSVDEKVVWSDRPGGHQLYVNGGLVWSTADSVSSTNYVTYTQDLTLKSGDVVQMYVHNYHLYGQTYFKDFKIQCDEESKEVTIGSLGHVAPTWT
ncbi:hypothetical protein [Methanolacinia paynteri]|uniref:hypothetical protein n=1 Tax=Methanolacinia paynteri TaxID=230356 RepID=UPI00064E3933|nr:hypothetical protein [Methanolacinia paynteri]